MEPLAAPGAITVGLVGARWRWLGQWWFLTAVAVLALNDHVLKARYGNWFTGKLSDFAGPVVVATMVAVLLGRRAGVVLTAVGFVALKTVPGVAEAAAPILGGVTLRDATDIIGLLALIPAWHLMGSHLPKPPTPVWAAKSAHSPYSPPKPQQRAAETTLWAAESAQSQNSPPKPWWKGAGTRSGSEGAGTRAGSEGQGMSRGRRRVGPLSVVGLVLAVMVTTATSEDDTPPLSVLGLVVDDTVIYAETTGGYDEWDIDPDDPPEDRSYVSHDGGMTWEQASDPPPGSRSRTGQADGTSANDSAGGSVDGEVCRSDGWCFRSRGEVVEHRSPDGNWKRSFALTWDQRRLFRYRSYEYRRGFTHDLPGRPAVVAVDGGEHVVVPMSYEGAVVLGLDGRWHRRAVGPIAPTDISGTFVWLMIGRWMVPIMGLLALLWIPMRAMQRGLIRGATKALTGVAALIIGVLLWGGTAFSWAIGEFNRTDPVKLGQQLIISSLLVLLIPLGFIRMLAGPVKKPGPDCLTAPALRLSDRLPPPPPSHPGPPPSERPAWDPGAGR